MTHHTHGPKLEDPSRYDTAAEFLHSGLWTFNEATGVVTGQRWALISHDYYGYIRTGIRHRGKLTTVLMHRVIWAYLHGPIPPGHEVNHINGVKDDNRPCNLELVTPAENNAHALRTGLRGIGPQLVDEVRRAAATGLSRTEIAQQFGLRPNYITSLVRGGIWQDATEPTCRIKARTGPLSTEQVREARRRVAAGDRQTHVARDFGVRKEVINYLIRGRTYRHVH